MHFKFKRYSIVYSLILTIGLIGCEFGRNLGTKEKIKIKSNDGTYTITALSEDIIKVSYSDQNQKSDQVYAPFLQEGIPMVVEEGYNFVIANTSKVSVRIVNNPFSITFVDLEVGEKLVGGSLEKYGDSTAFSFNLQNGEAIYGLGARGLPLNRRGNRLLNYNTQAYGNTIGDVEMNYSIPHLMSSVVYMLLVDNPAKAYFDIGYSDENLLKYESKGGNLSYYFVNGGSFAELMLNYTQLTGRQPMPPIWAMGYLQSRFGYRTQKEAETTVSKMQKAGYPMDALILDLYWFSQHDGDRTMGQFDFNKTHWPDPKGMVKRLADKGVKTITITEPFFTTNTDNYETLSAKGLLGQDMEGNTMDIPNFFWGNAGLLDIFKPEAKDWIWEQYKRLKNYGIQGFWVDLNEPEVHPDSMMHATGIATQVHGIYGHEWAKNLYERHSQDYPDERIFQMTRAGYAGTQRFGVIPWSGDVKMSWDGLRMQNSIIQSMSISGLGYIHSDAGGFLGNIRDPELYTRWMQFAAFTPIFRSHSSGKVPPEPIHWSQEVQDRVKPFIELRYELLPYNYTLAWKNSTTGMPLVVPLFTQYYEVSDTSMNEYLWGDSFLVAPVMDSGAKQMDVYIPDGGWYNYWTNEFIYGGITDTVNLTMDRIPLYVKAGSIIPTADPMTSTDYYNTDMLNLTYYAFPNDAYTQIYFDDGLTPDAFEKGLYELVNAFVSWDDTGMEMAVFPEGMVKPRFYNVRIIGLPGPPSNEIEGAEWDSEKMILTVQTTLLDGIRVEG